MFYGSLLCRFLLVAKLSVVMGVTWIFEVISWALTRDYTNVDWYFVIVDIWNFFQAVLIFIIFACKKTIRSQLEQKYPVFKSKSFIWALTIFDMWIFEQKFMLDLGDSPHSFIHLTQYLKVFNSVIYYV